MKKMSLVLAAVILSIAGAARAVEPVTMDQDGVSQMLNDRAGQTLRNMADGSCTSETCFDGQPILGRDGASVILDRQLTEYDPGHYKTSGGGRGGPVERWVNPTWTYNEKMAIPDRGAYVSEKEKSGLIFGGILGAIIGAVLAFALNPVAGVVALAAGIAGGYFIGKHNGESQPTEYQRKETYFAPQGPGKTGV